MHKFLAIIPARQGSKGVPGKNRRLLAGKPLIQYTIEAALGALPIEQILISTDDDEILKLAADLGLNTVYKRPPNFAQDKSTMTSVVEDALRWRSSQNECDTHIILLQPTSPFRTISDIKNAREMSVSKNLPVLGVSPMWTHPFECIQDKGNSWSYLAMPNGEVAQRQSYDESFYFINGALYLFSVEEFLTLQKIPIENAQLLKMDRINTIDIDCELDFQTADFLMQNLVHKKTTANNLDRK